jgi:hypothetical protein
LPDALVKRLTRPFSQFLRIEAAGGTVLLAVTLIALILARCAFRHGHSPPSGGGSWPEEVCSPESAFVSAAAPHGTA